MMTTMTIMMMMMMTMMTMKMVMVTTMMTMTATMTTMTIMIVPYKIRDMEKGVDNDLEFRVQGVTKFQSWGGWLY